MTQKVSKEFPWLQAPEGLDEDVRPIADEIIRRAYLNEELGKRYQRHRRIWTILHYALGAPAAALAAIAGVLAANSSQYNTLVGALALASAAIGGLVAFLNPASRASDANVRAEVHFQTANWTRYVITAKLPKADHETAGELLGKLQSMQRSGPAVNITPP